MKWPISGGLLIVIGIYQPSQFRLYYRQSLGISALITLILGGFIINYETMRAQLQHTTLELRTKELERKRALNLATEARLSSFESRIHPHFLFNALNSISSLIQDDPKLPSACWSGWRRCCGSRSIPDKRDWSPCIRK